jgi:hypothetical protein
MTGYGRSVAALPLALPLVLLAVVLLAAGCGNTASPAAARPTAAVQLSAATSLASADGGSWATIPMGGTGPNLFWQLFALPTAGGRWSLRTPPAIATNGALVLATPGQALVVGIRPSLDLSFSPVTSTSDGGRDWTTIPPDPGLANVPDALAAAPDGSLIALDLDQRVSAASAGSAAWSTLTSRPAVAATPAGRDCDLTAFTAAAYTPAGTPLLGGTCGKAGVAAIFADSSGAWHLTGPALPAALAAAHVQVLRLTRTGSGSGSGSVVAALLEASSGASAALVSAWTTDGARQWTVSPVLPLGGASPVSASFGATGAIAVVLSGDRGEILDGPHAAWQPLPSLPPARSITLALPTAADLGSGGGGGSGGSGATDALAADGSTLTVWRLGAGPARWSKVQVIDVPIQYGSSS